MLTNDIKKGMKLRFHDGRTGIMKDNKFGIIRTVEIDGTRGWFNDIGSCYISEISEVEVEGKWEKVQISKAHAKKLMQIGIN